MNRVFISYRRQDSAHAAGRIFDHLAQRLGDDVVFRDVDKIPEGTDYEQYIKSSITRCDILLAVIGERWLAVDPQRGTRRLDDPNDLLRRELEYAVQKRRAIIPVLVDAASMPNPDELPGPLQALTKLQAAHLRDSDFRHDFDRLFQVIETYEQKKDENITAQPPESLGDRITGEHLALLYSCWRAPQFDQQWGGRALYRFDIVLEAAPAVLDRIEKVEYRLPPAWPASSSPKEVVDKPSGFGLKELTWADLLARARVFIHGQDEPIYLSCHVRLSEHGPRLVQT
ncbi:MAG TPA: toll/interleukin-1 receptor domain-containing protein [Candidatus Binatia bacterium]|jgi:hypothetical protein